MVPICPRCGSQDTWRSHRRGFFDAFWSVFGRMPYRCRVCQARFRKRVPHSSDASTDPTPGNAEPES